MSHNMSVLMITSEAHPYAKAGGLGDVVPALAAQLAENGHDARIILPRYYSIDRQLLATLPFELEVRLGHVTHRAKVMTAYLPQSTVPVYFIDFEPFYGRNGIYGDANEPDYHDNVNRFAFLSKAAFALCRQLHWIPNIVHCHDWATAPALAYLNTTEKDGLFGKTAGIYSIHNVGYQGSYGPEQFANLDLPASEFQPGRFEYYGRLNLMQGALRHADKISTVSPSYAREICSAQFGYGMEGILRERAKDLIGILNGMDYTTWNPSNDEHLICNYDADDLAGKAKNKAYLQEFLGLEIDPEIPLFSIVSRMVSQKGFSELVAPGYGSLESILKDLPLQMIVLGTGERWCEEEFLRLAKIYPRLKVQLKYSERLSHLFQAASDFFLMPSLYEPCGLTQMYALRYGTIPLVSPTGGLADTVKDVRLDPKSATGIYVEYPVSPGSIKHAVTTALHWWFDRREELSLVQNRGMAQHFGWQESTKDYEKLYRAALQNRNNHTST